MTNDTWHKVVKAAEELFAERAYEQVTLSDIEARSGVSHGSVYHALKSKAGVAEAVCTAASASLHEQIRRKLDLKAKLPEAVRWVVSAQMSWFRDNRKRAIVLADLHAVIGWAGRDRLLKEEETTAACIRSWMARVSGLGQFDHFSNDLLYATVLGPGAEFGRRWSRNSTESFPDGVEDVLSECILKGLQWHKRGQKSLKLQGSLSDPDRSSANSTQSQPLLRHWPNHNES